MAVGAKTWMLVYSDSDVGDVLSKKPKLDREKSLQLAKKLFSSYDLQQIEDGCLLDTAPKGADIFVGCYENVSVVAASEFCIDYPSHLPVDFLKSEYGKVVCLHAMHSVVDWFAFSVWTDGKLIRSLSLSPDSGIMEDYGEKHDFERPYWAGFYPVISAENNDPSSAYPFMFHPLELGEATLLDRFGYQIEGIQSTYKFMPEDIKLLGFKRKSR